MSDAIASPIGRVSWPFVFGDGDPKAQGPSKYGLTLMLPKNVKAFKTLGINPAKAKQIVASVEEFVEQVREQAEALAKAKFKNKWQNTRYDPVLDGDEKVESWDGNANFWLIRCKTKFKPKVRQPKAEDGFITDGDDDPQKGFYPGCWARVAINLFTYNVGGNQGVGIGLASVQKAWNDDPFQMGGYEFDDDIEELEIDESDVEQFDDDDDDFELE